MSVIETIHNRHVLNRRARILSDRLASVIPENAAVLDVGCGDGKIARHVSENRPDLTIKGVDVLVRDETWIPVDEFDGRHLPAGDNEFDVVTFVDVLHHCDDPLQLLREACRVARQAVVIKDHLRDEFLARSTLRFMDWAANSRYGVSLPYNYWCRAQWDQAFESLSMEVEDWNGRPKLYWWPASLLFDRRLHFIARLSTAVTTAASVEADEITGSEAARQQPTAAEMPLAGTSG